MDQEKGLRVTYRMPDGTRTTALLDQSLVELWGEANQREASCRAVAEDVVPRALKEQPSSLSRTGKIERQLIEDTREALRMDWMLKVSGGLFDDPHR